MTISKVSVLVLCTLLSMSIERITANLVGFDFAPIDNSPFVPIGDDKCGGVELSEGQMKERACVKYLGGITFLLPDGCPNGASFKARKGYKLCVENEEILWTQCQTDTLLTGAQLTTPVFTDICSAICHGRFDTINNCPYNGRRLDGKSTEGDRRINSPVVDIFVGRK